MGLKTLGGGINKNAAPLRRAKFHHHTHHAPLSMAPLVGIIMGSISDWETMQHAAQILTDFGIPHETRVVSAHRTPDLMAEYAKTAASRGLRSIIAGAGGAAHLPGMTASFTTLPVLGVPVESRALKGVDSLHSIVQMPAGIPVATFAIGKAGATNAALYAVAMLATTDAALGQKLADFRAAQSAKVLATQAELPPPFTAEA
jgi:5-(carboxyamino)imidazole ribonucleotide mutase